VRAVAEELGRTLTSIYQLRDRLGLCKKANRYGPEFEAFIREKHALGWSDAEIAAAHGNGCERHTVGAWRKRLGLAVNTLSEHRRRKVAAKTREQLKRAGLPSIGYLRVKAFRDRARVAGWPEDLRPRAVQILNALWEHGPLTRRQLADIIGMPWKGTRKSLCSNDPEGSYLAHLINRGLVISLHRAHKITGKGRGRSVNLYSLPLWIERKVPA
jgi:hypothetical protein